MGRPLRLAMFVDYKYKVDMEKRVISDGYKKDKIAPTLDEYMHHRRRQQSIKCTHL